MDVYSNNNTARRYRAHVSQFGTAQFHARNPYVIAWWSTALPGFGHLLLNKYLRGFALFVWEIIININANLNIAMVYTFTGQFEKATQVLEERWIMLYIPVYMFAIWDSYRSAVDMNRIGILAKREGHRFNTMTIGSFEINYLDKRSPVMAIIWSILMPGTGQLYIHRITSSFFVLAWIIVISYYSHFVQGLTYMVWGEWRLANEVLVKEWLMFLPSIYGFAAYDAYNNTVEGNKLFISEQREFLRNNYQDPHFTVQLHNK